MFIRELFIFVIAFLATKFFWQKRRFFELTSKIPQSDFDYSWTNIRSLLMADGKVIFQYFYNGYKSANGIVKTWAGPNFFVTLTSPEDVKIIWNSRKCFDKPYFVKFPGMYQGTLFGDIDAWQVHRKIMEPFFGSQKTKNFLSIFNEKSKVLIRRVKEKLGDGEFDVFHYMTALTVETIINAMELDVDIQNMEDNVRDLPIKAIENASKVICKRMFSFWLHPEFIYRRTKYYDIEMKAKAHSAYTYVDDIIENIQKNNVDSSETKPTSFVRALMDPKHNLTRSEIVDEIRTFLIAAQDTSAITMSSTLLLLAMHKNVQNKVVEELREVLGNTQDAPFIDSNLLSQLKYLDMVVNESLRLFPVVPFSFRKAGDEIEITNGHIIPADTNITVPIFFIHRNKKTWGDDADSFRPERFEEEIFKKIHPYAFIPFTKGPRMCIGYRYALSLIKVQLANFLMRYEVDTTLKLEEIEFELNVTLNVHQGFRISIKDRYV